MQFKKYSTFIIVLLMFIALTGCSATRNNSSDISSIVVSKEDKLTDKTITEGDPNETMIFGFENEKNFAMFGYLSFFGHVYLNEEKKFVTEGERSMRIDMIGEPALGNSIWPRLQLKTKNENYKPSKDIKNYKAVSFDVFNYSGETITIHFGIFDVDYVYFGEVFKADNGKWTTIKLPFDFTKLENMNFKTKELGMFEIRLDNTKDSNKHLKLFMDNMKFEKK